MKLFSIAYTEEALKELKHIPKKQVAKIISKIELLAENPYPTGVKKLKGKMDLQRIRVGDYRVIYSIEKNILLIEVIRIRHRKDVYDNL